MQRYVSFLLVSILCITGEASACIIMSKPGQKVSTDTEQALVVWNPETKTEDFIRKINFHVDAEDFGFLVPTPSRPEIAESDGAVFDHLNALFPEQIPPAARGLPTAGVLAVPAGAAVEVLEEKRVGSMDVAVLKASDSTALLEWLKQNGYALRGAYQSWIDRCIQLDMIISAFKYTAGQKRSEVGVNTVRMTFKTEKPFFPYHEPEDIEPARRSLEIYVVAPQEMTAVLGTDGEDFAGNKGSRLAPFDLKQLEGVVPAESVPAYTAVVTQFRDYSRKRRPGDLYFVAAGGAVK